MTTPFQHTRLKSPTSIRLFTLFPSNKFDIPLCGELHEVSLNDNVKYEALSYVWGEKQPNDIKLIYINGGQPLEVTPSCYEALIYLRPRKSAFSRGRGRVLWVDAICIDQTPSDDSTRERNHQVRLMGSVYSGATKVLAWLGPGNSSTSRVFQKLRFGYVLDWAVSMLGVDTSEISLSMFTQLMKKMIPKGKIRFHF